MKINKQLKILNSMKSEISRIYWEAEKNGDSHMTICKRISEAHTRASAEKLPIHGKEFLRGYSSAFFDMLYHEKLVFVYVIDGKILAIDSPEYRKVSPQYVSEHCAASGHYAWRHKLNCGF